MRDFWSISILVWISCLKFALENWVLEPYYNFFCTVFYLNWNILFSQFKDIIFINYYQFLLLWKPWKSFLTNFLQKWPQCPIKSEKISFIVQQPVRETLVCLCRNRKFSKGHKYLPLWALAKLVWASRIADDVANFFLEPSLDQEVYRHQGSFYLCMSNWTFPSNELLWRRGI